MDDASDPFSPLFIQLAEKGPSVAIADAARRLSDEIYPVPMLALEVDPTK
jgi:hypothetical protein